MAIIPRPLDYTDRDFESARRRLFDLVRSVRPDWTDESIANIGNVIIELGAHIVDVLCFCMDSEALEAFIASATRRESMIALGRLANYRLRTASAATVGVTVTLDSAALDDIEIPAGTFVRNADPVDVVRFQLLEDLVINSGETSGSADAEHSENRQVVLETTGTVNLDVQLSEGPYLDEGIVVSTVGQGVFEEVTSLISSAADDAHYSVLVDANDKATVRFGDNVNGIAPTGTLTITYKIGGGARGNVEANKLKILESSIVDGGGRVYRGTVTNPTAASGGEEREGVEEARMSIPEAIRAAGDRSVTKDDFEINARRVQGVARALMASSDDDGSVQENTGHLYIVPAGGGIAANELLADVVEMVTVTKPTMPTFQVLAFTADYRSIDVYVRVHFSGPPSATATLIRAALTAFFEPTNEDGSINTNVDFGLNLSGQVFAWDRVHQAIRSVAGVRRIAPSDLRLDDALSDVNLLPREFPTLGEVTIINAANNQAV
jgi:hypothetical protein